MSRPPIVLMAAAFLLSVSEAFAGDLPDPGLTPGAVLTTDVSKVCEPGYSKSVRHVSGKVKAKVYREYEVRTHRSGEYEIDHLVSLELGGSNDITNLWPESYETTPWNAHVKDKLENKLHELICSGQLDIREAQKAMATDWIAAYKRYVRG
jgi:hypothetical protein